MQDAEQRSQLFAPGDFTAGYSDGKFLLQSGDGRFRLHPYLMIQVRNTTTWRVDGKQPNDTDDTQNGFEIRRAKFGFEGNAFSKELTYRMQFSADRHNGDPVLEDAWVRYQFADGLSLRGGQFRDPFAHDSLVSFRFMAAERTYTNEFFSPSENYVQGVDLIYGAERFTLTLLSPMAAAMGRIRTSRISRRTMPTTVGQGESSIWRPATGRITRTTPRTERRTRCWCSARGWTIGKWATRVSSRRRPTCSMRIRMALRIVRRASPRVHQNSPAGTGDSVHHDRYNWGAIAQAGYLFLPKWEVFGRWGYLHLDDNGLAAGTHESTNELTTGVNYYLHGQAAKFTLDVGWLPNGARPMTMVRGFSPTTGRSIIYEGSFSCYCEFV